MVTLDHVWTFPGGKKVIQKAAAVAGNVAVTKTVPAGKMWVLLNIMFSITTDATVANRIAQVFCRDPTPTNKFFNYASAVTASLAAQRRFFTRDVSATSTLINSLGLQILVATENVYLMLSSGVAGDAYDYLIEYLEIDAP